MAMVNPVNTAAAVMNPALPFPNPNGKDSRWLTLEVCREYQRNKCTRTDTECKFAHPPPHVEVQNGRVTCCFDSIKGKCQRKDPPCKYLHPPQHLKEQLLQNGRNNLILKNLQMQALGVGGLQPMVPGVFPTVQNSSHPGFMMDQTQNGGGPAAPMILSGGQMLGISGETSYYTDQLRKAHPYMVQAQLNPYLSPTLAAGNPVPGLAHTDVGATVPVSSGQVAMPTAAAGVANSQKTRADRLEAAPSSSSVGSSCDSSNVTWTMSQTAPESLVPTSQYSQLYFQPQVVEVLAGAGKKRPRDPSDDIVLGLNPGVAGMMPMVKRTAVADSKSGVPMYQPAASQAAYQQALAAMQLQQQAPFVPVTLPLHPNAQAAAAVTGSPPGSGLVTNANSVSYFDESNQLLATLTVCRDFKAGQCQRPQCKYVHLVEDYVEVSDGKVTVCRDAAKGKCTRTMCKYYHVPLLPNLLV